MALHDDIGIIDNVFSQAGFERESPVWRRLRAKLVEAVPSASANSARDAIATIIRCAVKEFDENATINVNNYADQVLRYVATAPMA